MTEIGEAMPTEEVVVAANTAKSEDQPAKAAAVLAAVPAAVIDTDEIANKKLHAVTASAVKEVNCSNSNGELLNDDDVDGEHGANGNNDRNGVCSPCADSPSQAQDGDEVEADGVASTTDEATPAENEVKTVDEVVASTEAASVEKQQNILDKQEKGEEVVDGISEQAAAEPTPTPMDVDDDDDDDDDDCKVISEVVSEADKAEPNSSDTKPKSSSAAADEEKKDETVVAVEPAQMEAVPAKSGGNEPEPMEVDDDCDVIVAETEKISQQQTDADESSTEASVVAAVKPAEHGDVVDATTSAVAPVYDVDDESQDGDETEKSAHSVAGALAVDPAIQRRASQDSCEAVPISSDSEEESEPQTNKAVPANGALKLQSTEEPTSEDRQQSAAVAVANNDEDDDDDDDCVLIEPDDEQLPMPQQIASNKRKAYEPNELTITKRPRLNPPTIAPAPAVGQLTIKDARSLMPSESAQPFGMSITSVTGGVTNPSLIGGVVPKLVPMNATTTPPPPPPPAFNSNGSVLSNTNNSNLLPGLTEDMYVLEAPSFIVPYIYEKPPPNEFKDMVKKFVEQTGLTDSDLAAVAVKPDEFDMMTEQNKPNKSKSKSRRSRREVDDSWSEQSEDIDDDEDDEDSDTGMRTKVLIKSASDDITALKGAIAPAPSTTAATIGAVTAVAKPIGQDNYFEGPLGMFFMDIGIGLVQEYVQSDLLRVQKRKLRKEEHNKPIFEAAVNALSGNLQASRSKNEPYRFTLKKCEFCNFKSESSLAMAHHYETPHMNGIMYKCNFCTYEVRNAQEIVYHMEAMHNIKARLVKPLSYHQCSNCSFEDNGKAKLARHQPVCAKKFRPEINLAPPNDWDNPAKIPRVKPRHGLVGTATAYQAMAAQAAAQKAALATLHAQQLQHQQQLQQQQQLAAQAAQLRSMQNAAAMSVQNASKMRGQQHQPKALSGGQQQQQLGRLQQPAARNAVSQINLPSYQLSSTGQVVQATNNNRRNGSGQPSISITPLPRQTTSAAAGTNLNRMSQQQNSVNNTRQQYGNSQSNVSNVANAVKHQVCEICDSFIKDAEQLRSHMQVVHKIKIHHKMINNRPPLNCQKCQKRFFTDQGLERHLLGAHGLVTSSMQENANQARDCGRCPICGKTFQWKLLTHVSRDHNMTLKPAHLSYKCTVCTATFGMYRQFETHVYNAHTAVANRAGQNRRSNQNNNAGRVGGNSGATSSGISNASLLQRTNESLLEPLKINDEITIIPQPATTKSRGGHVTESHVID